LPRADTPRPRLRDYRTLCYLSIVRRHLLLFSIMFVLLRCGAAPDQPDHQSEWRDVLRHKKTATTVATPRARQVYAAALSAFVRRHPGHSRRCFTTAKLVNNQPTAL